MVTAIMVPVIFFIFFLIVKKDKRKYQAAWEALAETEETEAIKGVVEYVLTEKKRFYQQYYIWSTVITLNDGKNRIKVIYEKPEHKKEATFEMTKRDSLICYGIWHGNTFIANRIVIN